MTYREEQFMKQMTEIAIEVAELRAENKLLKSVNDSLIQALHKPVVSGKQPIYQLCPKCFGEGQVINYNTGSTSSPMMRPCPTCNGAKTFLVQPVEAAGVCSAVDKNA